MRTLILLALAGLVLVCGQPQTEAQAQDRVEYFESDDATMNAAIANARAGLPRFWELYGNREGSDFMLKVGFPASSGGNEHIWVSDVQRGANGLSAVIANEPADVPTLRYGQRASFEEAWISDWALTHRGVTYGHYTTRVVVASMPVSERAPYAAFIASLGNGVP